MLRNAMQQKNNELFLLTHTQWLRYCHILKIFNWLIKYPDKHIKNKNRKKTYLGRTLNKNSSVKLAHTEYYNGVQSHRSEQTENHYPAVTNENPSVSRNDSALLLNRRYL